MAENTSEQPRRRGKGRPFAKGVSGNPGGRPKVASKVREALSVHADEMRDRLVALCRTEYGEDARMAAVVGRALEAYFDRIGVSPLKAVDAPPGQTGDEETAAMSDEELDKELN